MKLCVVLFAVLIGVALAKPPAGVTQKKCAKPCNLDYTPICGGQGTQKLSFGNICVMENYNCEKGASLKKISDGECPGGGGVRLA